MATHREALIAEVARKRLNHRASADAQKALTRATCDLMRAELGARQ